MLLGSELGLIHRPRLHLIAWAVQAPKDRETDRFSLVKVRTKEDQVCPILIYVGQSVQSPCLLSLLFSMWRKGMNLLTPAAAATVDWSQRHVGDTVQYVRWRGSASATPGSPGSIRFKRRLLCADRGPGEEESGRL